MDCRCGRCSARRARRRAQDSHPAPVPPSLNWTFDGPFGTFDRGQLQRGFKVYREVCQACHSLKLIAFRNLAEPGGPGFSAAQAAAIAAEYKIQDGPNDAGEMFERPGRVADHFPAPFPNDNAARAANGGALPPDLSLITKARSYSRGFPQFIFDLFTQFQEQGPNYVTALLQGYEQARPPASTCRPARTTTSTSPATPSACRSRSTTVRSPMTTARRRRWSSTAKDVTAFLAWAADPHMEARKRLGLQVMIFLLVLVGPALLHQEEGLGGGALSARVREIAGHKAALAPARRDQRSEEAPARGPFSF